MGKKYWKSTLKTIGKEVFEDLDALEAPTFRAKKPGEDEYYDDGLGFDVG